MDTFWEIACNISNHAGTILYTALAVLYAAYALRAGEGRREVLWQSGWLAARVGVLFLLLVSQAWPAARPSEVALFGEAVMLFDKVVPRMLWFPALAAVGGTELTRRDRMLMLAYGALMLFTPRTSDLASLFWGTPFLWGAVKLRRGGRRDRLPGWLAVGFALYLVNALANLLALTGVRAVDALILSLVFCPSVFALDLLGRVQLAWASPGAAPVPVPAEPDGVRLLAARYGLTQRETEIAGYINDGLTNREIAQRICTAEGTVKAHNYNIYTKLGITRRTQLVLAVDEARRGSGDLRRPDIA